MTERDLSQDGVTIAGTPIVMDYNGELQALVERFFQLDDLFRDRLVEVLGQLNSDEESVYSSSYPDLPPIQVNQLQWPMGASRYARALWALDWTGLSAVLSASLGYSLPATQPEDVPASWGSQYSAVSVRIEAESVVECKMLPLQPIRISHGSLDLWLLPMVDMRAQTVFGKVATVSTASWSSFFASIYGDDGPSVSAEFGVPDAGSTNNLSIGHVFDAGVLSVGMRYVSDMGLSTTAPQGRIVTAEDERAVLDARSDWSAIHGGTTGKLKLRGSNNITVKTRLCRDTYCGLKEWHLYKNTGSPIDAVPLCVHSLWNVHYQAGVADSVSRAAFEDFADAWLVEHEKWQSEAETLVIPGIRAFKPCGFDDFWLYSFANGDVCTIIKPMPTDWVPKCLIAQESPDVACKDIITYAVLDAGLDPSGSANAHVRGSASDYADIVLAAPATLTDTVASGTAVPIYYERGSGWKLLWFSPGSGGGGGSSEFAIFTLDAATSWTAGETISATVTYASGSSTTIGATITVKAVSKYRSPSGSVGVAVRGGDGSWIIVELEQQALLVLGQIVGTGSGSLQGVSWSDTEWDLSGCVAFSSFPYVKLSSSSVTANNDRGFTADPDDDALLLYDAVNDAYIIEAIHPDKPWEFAFTLDDDMPATYTPSVYTIDVTGYFMWHGHTFPAQVVDVYRRCTLGKSGDRGMAAWNPIQRQWEVTVFETRATRVKGQLTSSMSSGSSTAVLDNTVALNGKWSSPSSPGLTVYNIHAWDADNDGWARAEYNESDGHWELYQVDCPEL